MCAETASPLMPTPPSKNIVDALIEERAGPFMARPRLWAALQRVLYPMLRYETAKRMSKAVATRPAHRVMSFASRFLDLKLELTGLEHIPREGSFLLIANHPTGIADGVAVYDALRAIRPDLCFFANRDALRVSPGLSDMIIPVEWVPKDRAGEKSLSNTRELAKQMVAAFRAERPIAIFPSGAPGVLRRSGFIERPWKSTFVGLAKRNKVALVPMAITARNSPLYYASDWVSDPMRNMTLFLELLNKRKRRFKVHIGAPIAHDALPNDMHEASETLRKHIEFQLAKDPHAQYQPGT